jgi:hypothetical protein
MADTEAERVAAASSLYSKAFEIDPVITYLLSPMGSKSARLAYLPSYFKALLTAASMNEALFFEANDFKSISILFIFFFESFGSPFQFWGGARVMRKAIEDRRLVFSRIIRRH